MTTPGTPEDQRPLLGQLVTRLSRLRLELNDLPRQPPLTEDQCHRFLSILTEIESVEDQIAALKSLSSTNSRANEDH